MNRRISKVLRQLVARRAAFRCEYCLVPEAFLATIFHIDHIRSLKHGGETVFENLAFACPHCNQNKGSDIATFLDADNERTVRFFNPRKDIWQNHFAIEKGEILPKTTIAEATIRILDVNQAERLIFRQALISAGFYPAYRGVCFFI